MLKDGADWRLANVASWSMAIASFVLTVLLLAVGYRVSLWLALHAVMLIVGWYIAFTFRCASCDKSIYSRELTSGNRITGGPVIVRRFFPESRCSRCRSRLD